MPLVVGTTGGNDFVIRLESACPMTALRNHNFEITPYIGALPLQFGMSAEAVHALLGAPQQISTLWNKSGFSHSWTNPDLNIGFSNDDALNHVGLIPNGISVSLNGTEIWTRDSCVDPNPTLLRFDASPRECFGFLVYLEIGIATTGFHDDDSSQHALCVFARGAYDDLLSKSTTPDLSRYSNPKSKNGG
ncbi:hypothetical protein [Novipirellula aureliae]|uniref:hypothetical protein n=1 Tax=Novipirellula aureliae TaxID=2527966 RepID=UPI0011B42870|nr:hypothetical protein [Novipirellula aureliae]